MSSFLKVEVEVHVIDDVAPRDISPNKGHRHALGRGSFSFLILSVRLLVDDLVLIEYYRD